MGERGFVPLFFMTLVVLTSLLHAQSDLPLLQLTFTTIDVPGAAITTVYGINNTGSMVGNYAVSASGTGHGFLYNGGNFTVFDYPNANSTIAWSVNDLGLISGEAFIMQDTAAVGFRYDGATFTTIHAPGKSATLARGINNAGVIVGADGTLNAVTGFALVGTRFKAIAPFGNFNSVFADGINNQGEIVGATTGGVGDCNGFVYKAGKFRTIVFPGTTLTAAFGVNDSGIIVGWYQGTGASIISFATMKGKYASLSYPGALQTFAFGINNSGQIVGSYTFDQQTYHGFVTSPITSSDFLVEP